MTDERSGDLVARWHRGDAQAAAELFRRYTDRLIVLARSRLSKNLARRIDPEDVVQSVYRSFFAAAQDGRYDLQRGGDLWRLLVTITLNKLHNQAKLNGRQKRALSRERGFGSEESLFGLLASGHKASPLEAVALAEELELLMHRLEPMHRRIVEMRLQGCKLEKIAADVKRSVRMVSHILEQVKLHLNGRFGADSPWRAS